MLFILNIHPNAVCATGFALFAELKQKPQKLRPPSSSKVSLPSAVVAERGFDDRFQALEDKVRPFATDLKGNITVIYS